MPEYTRKLNLYKPSRLDSDLPIDETLAQNFQSIDDKMGSALEDQHGVMKGTLKESIDSRYNENKELATSGIFHQDIEVTYHRDAVTGTDYSLTRVKHKDKDGNIIKLRRGFPNDDPKKAGVETARSFATRNNTSLTLNASTYTTGATTRRGTDIHEGKAVIGDNNYFRWELGVKADNTLKAYPIGTSAQAMINDGVIYSFAGFCPFIIGGQKRLEDEYINVSANSYEYHPRQAVGQYANKDLVFLTCDGRTQRNQGMKIEDLARIFYALGVDFAFNLDGGGSAQTVVRGTQINRNSDENGFLERPVADFIYFSKEEKSKKDRDIGLVAQDVGFVNKKVEDTMRSLQLLGQLPQLVNVNSSPKDLNSITVSGFYWGHAALSLNIPISGISWGILHFQYDDTSAMQLAIPFHESSGSLMTRRTDGTDSSWRPWRAM